MTEEIMEITAAALKDTEKLGGASGVVLSIVHCDDYHATEIHRFRRGCDTIEVEISNTVQHFAWRMRVNGKKWADWTTHYAGLLIHDGYCLATAYWSPALPEFIPFQIAPSEPI